MAGKLSKADQRLGSESIEEMGFLKEEGNESSKKEFNQSGNGEKQIFPICKKRRGEV